MKKIILLSLIAVLFSIACKKENPIAPKPNGHLNPGDSLKFAGYTWKITNSSGGERQPGPNIFDPSYAWVDNNGYLHLKLAKGSDGKFHCAELAMTKSLGFGTYQWFVNGPIDKLDKNVVFGLFNYSGSDGFDEMDIEYSQWGYATNNNILGFTVYPQQGSTQDHVYSLLPVTLTDQNTTQRFTRTKDSVAFQSCEGFHDDNENVYASATFKSPPNSLSQLAMPVLMNLWLYGGVQPPDGYTVEIVIHDFKFKPL